MNDFSAQLEFSCEDLLLSNLDWYDNNTIFPLREGVPKKFKYEEVCIYVNRKESLFWNERSVIRDPGIYKTRFGKAYEWLVYKCVHRHKILHE